MCAPSRMSFSALQLPSKLYLRAWKVIRYSLFVIRYSLSLHVFFHQTSEGPLFVHTLAPDWSLVSLTRHYSNLQPQHNSLDTCSCKAGSHRELFAMHLTHSSFAFTIKQNDVFPLVAPINVGYVVALMFKKANVQALVR